MMKVPYTGGGSVSTEGLIELLRKLDYDDIVDICELLKARQGDEERYWVSPNPIAQQIIRMYELLAGKDQSAFYGEITNVRDQIAPRRYRKSDPETGKAVARGTIQIKTIPRNGKIHGPYLYLRVWATGGGWEGRKKRLENIYIGRKALAVAYEQGLVISDEIIDAYYSGTLDVLEQRAKGEAGQ